MPEVAGEAAEDGLQTARDLGEISRMVGPFKGSWSGEAGGRAGTGPEGEPGFGGEIGKDQVIVFLGLLKVVVDCIEPVEAGLKLKSEIWKVSRGE